MTKSSPSVILLIVRIIVNKFLRFFLMKCINLLDTFHLLVSHRFYAYSEIKMGEIPLPQYKYDANGKEQEHAYRRIHVENLSVDEHKWPTCLSD